MLTPEIALLFSVLIVTSGITYTLSRQSGRVAASEIDELRRRMADLEEANKALSRIVGNQGGEIVELRQRLQERNAEILTLRNRLRTISGMDLSELT